MSFINAPFKEDRGRKPLREESDYQRWDYLQDSRPEADKRAFPVGRSDARTKFGAGFYRRPAAAIQSDRERRAFEEGKESFSAATAAARAEHLVAQETRNGNVIEHRNEGSDSKLFLSRRSFPSREAEVAHQNHSRQKVGASRFHIELTPTEQAHRERQITHRFETQKQTASLLGYGRSDLPTRGVVDCFRDSTYREADLISKPKLKAPPPDIAAARNGGGVYLNDGSGYNYATARSQQGGPLSSRQPEIRAGVSTNSPQIGRRANRGNMTSNELSQVFSYEHVASQSQRQRAVARVDVAALPPAGARVPPSSAYSRPTQAQAPAPNVD